MLFQRVSFIPAEINEEFALIFKEFRTEPSIVLLMSHTPLFRSSIQSALPGTNSRGRKLVKHCQTISSNKSADSWAKYFSSFADIFCTSQLPTLFVLFRSFPHQQGHRSHQDKSGLIFGRPTEFQCEFGLDPVIFFQ